MLLLNSKTKDLYISFIIIIKMDKLTFEKAVAQCKAMGGEPVENGCRVKKCKDGYCSELIITRE
jgi:hypothetical protein